jgi:hypothetical protein
MFEVQVTTAVRRWRISLLGNIPFAVLVVSTWL